MGRTVRVSYRAGIGPGHRLNRTKCKSARNRIGYRYILSCNGTLVGNGTLNLMVSPMAYVPTLILAGIDSFFKARSNPSMAPS